MIIVTTYPLFAGQNINRKSYEYDMYEDKCKKAAKRIFAKEGWCTPQHISKRTIFGPYISLLKYATYGIIQRGEEPYGTYPYPIDILQIETDGGVRYFYKCRQAEIAAELLSKYNQPMDDYREIQNTLQSASFIDLLTERLQAALRAELKEAGVEEEEIKIELTKIYSQEHSESNS